MATKKWTYHKEFFFGKLVPILEPLNPLSANSTKWPNTFKQFVGKLPMNCFSVFGHFVNLALKGLKRVNLMYQ